MEPVLRKLARQLNAYDEASLMALWEKYASEVEEFEPTERWEEAALIFSMIQAVRWKNQLFNHHWSARTGAKTDGVPPNSAFTLLDEIEELPDAAEPAEAADGAGGPVDGEEAQQRAKILDFTSFKRY